MSDLEEYCVTEEETEDSEVEESDEELVVDCVCVDLVERTDSEVDELDKGRSVSPSFQ